MTKRETIIRQVLFKHDIHVIKIKESKCELDLPVVDVWVARNETNTTKLSDCEAGCMYVIRHILRSELKLEGLPRMGIYTRKGGYTDVPADQIQIEFDLL